MSDWIVPIFFGGGGGLIGNHHIIIIAEKNYNMWNMWEICFLGMDYDS